MSEEERQAIIHLLDKQARYEYCIENNISFSDEDYEAYIIKQSMINKDKEIDRLNNIINGLEKWLNEYYKSNRKWYNTELSNHDKQYYGEIYRNTEFMIVKFLKQLKELKEKHEN